MTSNVASKLIYRIHPKLFCSKSLRINIKSTILIFFVPALYNCFKSWSCKSILFLILRKYHLIPIINVHNCITTWYRVEFIFLVEGIQIFGNSGGIILMGERQFQKFWGLGLKRGVNKFRRGRRPSGKLSLLISNQYRINYKFLIMIL